MLDMDRKSNLVKESLPSNIRSSGTLKAISVHVQHGRGVYLQSNIPDKNCTFFAIPLYMFSRDFPSEYVQRNGEQCVVPIWTPTRRFG